MSALYRISKTSENWYPGIYGMASPDHTYNHTVNSFYFWLYIVLEFKKYCIVFNNSIEDSRLEKKPIKYIIEMY